MVAAGQKSRIYYTRPSITDLEVRYATDAAANGWGERCYDYINRFESDFATRIGTSHAVSTSSGTGAIHMGLAGLGIGSGDEVILGDINWIASAAPIVHLGARPVLVDVLADSWCLDPKAVEEAITPRTRAIMAVHLYGNLCDMDALLKIGAAHGIPVVEDAAEALGSFYHGRPAGSLGAFATFSFHGTKTITTGEGGMFVTNDRSLFDRVTSLSNHGRVAGQKRLFWAEMVGFKYKLSNIDAAIGCAQMERYDDLIARKRQIFLAYRDALEGLPLALNPEPDGCINGFWMPTAVVHTGVGFDRDALIAAFRAENVDGRTFFWPLSMLPMFDDKPGNRVSYGLHLRAINLPSYHDMTNEDINRVARIVRNTLS